MNLIEYNNKEKKNEKLICLTSEIFGIEFLNKVFSDLRVIYSLQIETINKADIVHLHCSVGFLVLFLWLLTHLSRIRIQLKYQKTIVFRWQKLSRTFCSLRQV